VENENLAEKGIFGVSVSLRYFFTFYFKKK